jgi:hypothetical protein
MNIVGSNSHYEVSFLLFFNTFQYISIVWFKILNAFLLHVFEDLVQTNMHEKILHNSLM